LAARDGCVAAGLDAGSRMDAMFDCRAVLAEYDDVTAPVLTALPASSMHVTEQGLPRLPDPTREQLADLVDAVKLQL
jgi:hypothetical protein